MQPQSFEELQAQYNAPLSQQAQKAVGGLVPYATTLSSQNDMGMLTPQHIAQPASGGFLSNLTHKIGAIGSEAGHILGGVAKWAITTTYNMGKSVVSLPVDAYHLGLDTYRTGEYSAQNNELGGRLSTIQNNFKQGKISSAQYKSEMQQWTKDMNHLSQNFTDLVQRTGHDGGAVVNDTINTAAAIITVMTGGLTEAPALGLDGLKASVSKLSSLDARSILASAENMVSKVALDKVSFGKLAPAMQSAVKDSIYSVFVNSGSELTSAQTARAVATNLLVKYPLGYSAVSSSAQKTYKDMSTGHYGDALKDIGFNSILLLSGGPIGWAMKETGRGLKAVSVAAGLRPGSMLDELSSYIADGDRRALAKIAQQKIDIGHSDEVKAMIIAMDSNLKRTAGNSGQAVLNIVNHLEQFTGWQSLKQNMTHEEAWNNLVGYWKHSDGLEALKREGKIVGVAATDPRPIVPLRWTTPDKINITNVYKEHGWDGVDAYFHSNPNLAAVNNVNLAKQLQHIRETVTDPNMVEKAIMSIPTRLGLEGIPKDYADKMAKDGYVAGLYQGHNLPVVPFDEGSKTLATTAAEGEFFVRASSPVPVMTFLGSMLQRAGLSPEAASKQTYDVFNAHFAGHLDNSVLESYASRLASKEISKAAKVATTDVTGWEATGLSKSEIAVAKAQNLTPELVGKAKISGGEVSPARQAIESEIQSSKSPLNTGDYMLKRIRNYMNEPTRGGVMFGEQRVRAPITDMRQLEIKDIQKALELNGQELDRASAIKVRGAIMQSHLDIPFAVATAGGRLQDYAYKAKPYRAYMRVLGAGRFTWNPFFRHMRLPFKAEFLSQAEAGGKFITAPGLNWAERMVFRGKYQEFDSTINALKSGKLLPGGLGDEAADVSGTQLAVRFGEHYPKDALYPVASLISSMAKRAGLDTETFIHQFPQEASDAARTILNYDRRSSFLNSPMVRTLNFAFFPARFNIKVATVMARFLSKQTPVVQFAVIKGMTDAHSFFNSPQGQAWYSQNSDIIGLMKYISPAATMSEVAQILGTHGESIGAFGELGGLPFGWIPALLDAEGLIHLQEPFVNPRTGAVAKDYIPTTDLGRLSAAVQDLVQSLFSYPGSTLGLPSKTMVSSKVANALTGANTKTDFTAKTPTLSPEKQSFQQIVKQVNNQPSGVLPPLAAPPESTTIPLHTPPVSPRPTKGGSSRTYNSKLKRNRPSTAFEGQPPLP